MNPEERLRECEQRLARNYLEAPYGHYKDEVYPIFCDILGAMGDIRILDIGAGPGHLAYEYYLRYPQSKARFTLLDSWKDLLETALTRPEVAGHQPELVNRDYNKAGWASGLGPFEAIVSNNSLFNVKPEMLPALYQDCYDLLAADGIILNQQSCGYETARFEKTAGPLAVALSPEKQMTSEQVRQVKNAREESRRLREELSELKKTLGGSAEYGGGYASLHVPASAHVCYLSEAGFRADVIWRKMEFVVIVGVKGMPFGNGETSPRHVSEGPGPDASHGCRSPRV